MKTRLYLLKPLIGKKVEVIKCTHEKLNGLTGTIIFESRNMFGILVSRGNVIFIPKSTCIFKLHMHEKKIVIVNGKLLENRFMKLRKIGRRRKRVAKRKNNVIS